MGMMMYAPRPCGCKKKHFISIDSGERFKCDYCEFSCVFDEWCQPQEVKPGCAEKNRLKYGELKQAPCRCDRLIETKHCRPNLAYRCERCAYYCEWTDSGDPKNVVDSAPKGLPSYAWFAGAFVLCLGWAAWSGPSLLYWGFIALAGAGGAAAFVVPRLLSAYRAEEAAMAALQGPPVDVREAADGSLYIEPDHGPVPDPLEDEIYKAAISAGLMQPPPEEKAEAASVAEVSKVDKPSNADREFFMITNMMMGLLGDHDQASKTAQAKRKKTDQELDDFLNAIQVSINGSANSVQITQTQTQINITGPDAQQ